MINISNTGDKFNLPTIEQIEKIDPPKMIIFERILIKKDGAEKKMAAKTYQIVN